MFDFMGCVLVGLFALAWGMMIAKEGGRMGFGVGRWAWSFGGVGHTIPGVMGGRFIIH